MTRLRVGALGGSIALLLGAGVLVAESVLSAPDDGALVRAAWLAGSYFLAALPLGVVWPRPSWAWGIWVTLPLIGLLLVSVGFAGQLGAFVGHDLGPLAASVGAAMLGGKAGAIGRRIWFPPDARRHE